MAELTRSAAADYRAPRDRDRQVFMAAEADAVSVLDARRGMPLPAVAAARRGEAIVGVRVSQSPLTTVVP
jgi:hypothetical protein